MWFLLGTTLTASFFDSLNPSAIAQQMLLQAMVKKKRHIWFFICGIGTANLIMGLAIYYGIATWVSKFLTKIVNAYPLYVYGAAAIGGIAFWGLESGLSSRQDKATLEKTIMDVRKLKMSKPLPSFPRYHCLSGNIQLYCKFFLGITFCLPHCF